MLDKNKLNETGVIKRRAASGTALVVIAAWSLLAGFMENVSFLTCCIISGITGIFFLKTKKGPIYKQNELAFKIVFYVVSIFSLLFGSEISSTNLTTSLLIILFYSLGAPWGRNGYKNQGYSLQQPKIILKGKWWFYVSAIAICFLTIIFTLSGFVQFSRNSYSSSSNQTQTKTLTPAEKAKRNWNNKIINFNDGTFKITKIAKIKSYTYGSDMVPGLFLVGDFTNKSSEAVSVTDFLNDHTDVTSVGKNSENDMNAVAYRESSPKYKQLFRNADDKTRPNKTVKCAVQYITDKEMGEDIPNNFRFEITKSNGDVIYKVNLKNLRVVKTNYTLDQVLKESNNK